MLLPPLWHRHVPLQGKQTCHSWVGREACSQLTRTCQTLPEPSHCLALHWHLMRDDWTFFAVLLGIKLPIFF